MDESKIRAVEVTGHSKTRFLGDEAIRRITADVVQYQTLNVDSVSGATVTSGALKTAVTKCIKAAGGDPSALQSPKLRAYPGWRPHSHRCRKRFQ